MDVWGRIFLDHWEGRPAPHYIERDDGLVHEFASAANYFEAPRSDEERSLLDELKGPVLDLGAGAGSYALHLQERGLEVTAIDSSPGAIRVCGERGCRNAEVMDIRDLHLPDGKYRSIIVMGNTLGVHQTPGTLGGLLTALRRACTAGARLVCTTIDPLETRDPAHLAYHRRNLERGLPPGLTTIRLKYRDRLDDWVPLWLPTTAELDEAFAASGWDLAARHIVGPHRLDSWLATG